MRWSSREQTLRRKTLTHKRTRSTRVLLALLCLGACAVAILPFVAAQPDGKRITFYTAQTSYSLPVLDRNNSEYAGLLECLEPIGPVSAKLDGKKWKLKFAQTEAQFEQGKTKARIAGRNIELAAPFVLENGRGLVPLRSLRQLIAAFVSVPIDFHENSRRAFIGAAPVRVNAHKVEGGKVAFTFSAPVNPVIATEPGKLRMSFTREPIVSDQPAMTFDDKTISTASYAEANGSAELTVNGSTALLATFSDDRKTITVAPVPQPSAPVAQAPAPSPAAPAPGTQTPRPAVVRTRPLVIIDAAHGGDDRGATLSIKLAEKDVTMAFARRLRHELHLRGLEAAMVRDGDSTLSSSDRARIANASGAVLYIALHAAGTGSGLHFFTAMLPAQAHKQLAFIPDATAQAGFVQSSRAIVSAISTELLRHDMQAPSLPAAVAPLNNVAAAAMAVEIAPPAHGAADDLASASYQQSMAVALANALAAAQSRLPQEVGR